MHVPAPSARRVAARSAAAVLAIAALTLAACADKGKSGTGSLGALSGSPSVAPSPTTAPTTPPPSTTVAPSSSTTTSAPSGPTIVDFSIKQQPACPVVATSDSPFSRPGSDIIVQWTVTGATGVALSLDNPGFFKQNGTGSFGDYGATGTMELSFSCDVTVQPNTTHVYTLDTIGGGPSVEKTLTVTKQTSP